MFDPTQMGPMAPPPEAAAPQDAGVPGITSPHFRTGLQNLQQALEDEPDDKDSSALAGVLQKLYALIADRQKETDDMMEGKISQRALRRP